MVPYNKAKTNLSLKENSFLIFLFRSWCVKKCQHKSSHDAGTTNRNTPDEKYWTDCTKNNTDRDCAKDDSWG